MSGTQEYSTKKTARKAVFNIAMQAAPIIVALTLIPILISGMGKDGWAKYSIGVSLVFLSNYFSFGIGPTLNRRVSALIGNKQLNSIKDELKDGLTLTMFAAIGFSLFLFSGLLIAYYSGVFSIVKTQEDLHFFAISTLIFLVVFSIIPLRSVLEAYGDFYFLAVIRVCISSGLFLIPFLHLKIGSVDLVSIVMSLGFFYFALLSLYIIRVSRLSRSSGIEIGLKPHLQRKRLKALLSVKNNFIKEVAYFALFFMVSALVLFFDRFFYPLFFETEFLADHVTMLDLFNRVSIVSGTISLVYFSAISVWFQEKRFGQIATILKKQLALVGFGFVGVIIMAYFFIEPIMLWWLDESYSDFISSYALLSLLGCLAYNYVIILLRPLQAVGKVKESSFFLLYTTVLYLVMVLILGFTGNIGYHGLALAIKGGVDSVVLFRFTKQQGLI